MIRQGGKTWFQDRTHHPDQAFQVRLVFQSGLSLQACRRLQVDPVDQLGRVDQSSRQLPCRRLYQVVQPVLSCQPGRAVPSCLPRHYYPGRLSRRVFHLDQVDPVGPLLQPCQSHLAFRRCLCLRVCLSCPEAKGIFRFFLETPARNGQLTACPGGPAGPGGPLGPGGHFMHGPGVGVWNHGGTDPGGPASPFFPSGPCSPC